MKVRVYFYRETDPEITLKGNEISRQVLDTIYDLVWECEFKNILADSSGTHDSLFVLVTCSDFLRC